MHTRHVRRSHGCMGSNLWRKGAVEDGDFVEQPKEGLRKLT